MISNNRISGITKDLIRKVGPRLEDAYTVLVAVAPQEGINAGRYLWNLHIHNRPRAGTKDYLLLGIPGKPDNDRDSKFNFDIEMAFIVPRDAASLRKTAVAKSPVHAKSKRSSWLDTFKCEFGDCGHAEDVLNEIAFMIKA